MTNGYVLRFVYMSVCTCGKVPVGHQWSMQDWVKWQNEAKLSTKILTGNKKLPNLAVSTITHWDWENVITGTKPPLHNEVVYQGPDLQRILRQTYDSAALRPDLHRACELRAINKQESPADAVKPARRKSMQKLLQFDVFRFISPNSISPNFKV